VATSRWIPRWTSSAPWAPAVRDPLAVVYTEDRHSAKTRRPVRGTIDEATRDTETPIVRSSSYCAYSVHMRADIAVVSLICSPRDLITHACAEEGEGEEKRKIKRSP